MILESQQIICSVFTLQGIQAPYKLSHQNHPCNIFARNSRENFQWVKDYCFSLSKEFIYRYDKVHKSSLLLKWVSENESRLSFPKHGATPFALAMPDEYKTDDPVESYRNYYRNEKQHLFNWKNRDKPEWL